MPELLHPPLKNIRVSQSLVGTIVSARGGFGGHVSFGKHQSFIPACNSTTVRGEMARLGRTADRFPEKLKCQTFEWKTDLCRHHVDQPPPLMLPTIPVHYYLSATLFYPVDRVVLSLWGNVSNLVKTVNFAIKRKYSDKY